MAFGKSPEESGSVFEDDKIIMSDGSTLALSDVLSMKRKELDEAARVLGVDPAILTTKDKVLVAAL